MVGTDALRLSGSEDSSNFDLEDRGTRTWRAPCQVHSAAPFLRWEGDAVLCCCAAVLLCCCAAVLLCCCAAALLRCCAAALLRCCAAVLLCCCAAVLLCCCAAVLLCCCASCHMRVGRGRERSMSCEGDLLVSYMEVLQPLQCHFDGASVLAGFALALEPWEGNLGSLGNVRQLVWQPSSKLRLLSTGIQLAGRLVGGASGAMQLLGCQRADGEGQAKLKSESGFWATCLSTASQALIPLPLNPKPQLSMSPLFSCPPLPTGTWIPADLVLPWLGRHLGPQEA